MSPMVAKGRQGFPRSKGDKVKQTRWAQSRSGSPGVGGFGGSGGPGGRHDNSSYCLAQYCNLHADHDQHKGLAPVSLLCKLSSISKASLSWLGCWWEAKASCFPNIRLGVVLAAQSAQPRKKETTHSMHRLLANTPYSSTNQPRNNCSTDAFIEQNSRIYLYFLDTQVSLAPTPVSPSVVRK